MATSRTHQRWLRSAAQLQALAQMEREIRASDPHTRRKYLRDFNQAFRSYREVLSLAQLDAALLSADILLVGDYHALPASQHFAAKLIRKLAAARGARSVPGIPSLILGLEFLFACDQPILDDWMRGGIAELGLRQRVRFDVDWGYGWAPFYSLLQTARASGAGIFALDCMPRDDLRKIAARDRHAVEKVGQLLGVYPEARIVVLFGESHMAPNHLPALLRECCPADHILTVLQNVDSLYWQAAREARDRVDAVRVEDDVVCVFNSTPLEKYQAYRQCLQRWRR